MRDTQKYEDEVRRCLGLGELAWAGEAAVAGYRAATDAAVEALGFLAAMRAAIPRALGDEAPAVLSSLSPELAGELDAMDDELEAAFAGVGR